jgi:hypothetical protein
MRAEESASAGAAAVASVAPAPIGIPAATAYGEHLRLVVTCALAARPQLFSADERALAQALPGATTAAQDVLGRLCARVRQSMPMVAGAELARDAPAGWTLDRATEIALAPAAAALVRAALAVAFADAGADLSLFPRLALGRHPLPSASPCALALAAWAVGGVEAAASAARPRGRTPPAFSSRLALDAWLDACAARAAGPSPALAAAALAAVEACAGSPWPLLGGQLDASHAWIAALSDCLAADALPAADRARAWRALRRAPCPPRIARRVWEAVHRRAHARPGRWIAHHLATMRIWTAGECERWRARARPPRAARPHAPAWAVGRLSAWLEHDASGAVVAQGERVEAHAARRLALQGWQAAHAEGGFWSALAEHLLWPALCDGVPDAWVAPLQLLPLDWQRWGFAARRAHALDGALAAVARDPAAARARAQERVAARPWDRWSSPPDEAAAAAVVERMPRPALVGLLRAVVADPRAGAGLPDLIAWRGSELKLWEVKSPRDQLSDAQRQWLGWLLRAGVSAGELRVDARPSEQTSWLAPGAQPTTLATGGAAPPRKRAADGQPIVGALTALCGSGPDGRMWRASIAPGSQLGAEGPPLAAEPQIEAARWRGRVGADAVIGWGRPLLAVAALAVDAVLVEGRRGRRVVERRWHAVPAGWLLPLLIAEVADARGGMVRRASVLTRASGWLIPRARASVEPVLARSAEIASASADSALDWRALPASEPPRPEAVAAALGLAQALASQLELLGAREHLVAHDAARGAIRIAVAAPDEALWLAHDARLALEALAVPPA